MSPRSFDDAQELADCFKGQQLVIVNLRNVDRELSKRIVDFCAGLTYALGGAVWPIADRVFLLAPLDIEVLDEKGKQASKRVLFFNQL
jgi:cell division inhibitor SepF